MSPYAEVGNVFSFGVLRSSGARSTGLRHASVHRPKRSVAAVTITALLSASAIGGLATSASATNTGFVPETDFTIDADLTGSDDWGSLYGPGTTPDGYPTTGVYATQMNPDECADDADDSAKGGVKFDDGPYWTTITKQVTPSKDDLTAIYEGAEKVLVGGTYNDILYVAYERCTADSGSMYAGLFIDDGDGVLPSEGDAGDYLILFKFNPSDSHGSAASVYKFDGTEWVSQPTNVAQFDLAASQTIGEAAVNLTTLGILPADSGQCTTIDAGGIGATAAGYSTDSALKDLVALDPFPISNCGALKVDKTSPVDDTTTTFLYTAFQDDNGDVFGANLNVSGVNDNMTAGGQKKVLAANLLIGQQDTWSNVIASPDYVVEEDMPLDAGWSLKTIECSYTDIFSAGYPTKYVTLYEEGDYTGSTLQLPPSILGTTGIAASSCTIDNTFTGVRLVKEGHGDTSADFDFTVGGESTTLKLGDSQTFPATAGEDVVMTEGTLPDDSLPWALDKIECTDSNDDSVGSVDVAKQEATVTAVEGDLITCVFTNEQDGKLIVQKASDGGTGTFGITGTAAGDITTTEDDGTVSGNTLTEIVPAGDGYSVGEDSQAGWKLDSITCDMGEDDPTDIHIGAGEVVTCTVANSKLGTVSLTKSVTGVASGYEWSFDFTLNPGASGDDTQTAAGTGNSTSSDVLSWTDLVPGTQYTITEFDTTGWNATIECKDASDAVVPDANGSTAAYDFTVTPGMVLTCAASNDAKPADLTLKKTVTGVADDYDWSFDFTLTPAATGGGVQTASGTGPDDDTLTWTNLVPGAQYVISEASDGDYSQLVTCAGVTDLDDSDLSVTFVAELDQSINCSASNAAAASSLTLTKTVTGVADDYEWSFDFTLTPAATGGGEQTASGTGSTTSDALIWTDLIPGTQYVISETGDSNYTQSLSCPSVTDLDDSDTSVTFVAGFDDAVTCSALNEAKPSDIQVTKTVTGVADDYEWSFDFTLTPAATGGGTQTASGTGPDSDVLNWSDLVPGTEYVISEEVNGDYDQSLTCDGVEDSDDSDTSVTFVAGFDQSITCDASNDAKPSDIQVTKTVTGVADDYEWSFDFTLTPAATGGGTQTASGTGPDSDVLNWSDLVPGTEYVISEEVNGDYTQSLTCDGVEDLDQSATSVTFVAGFDQSITCDASNDAKPSSLSLTKTVTGVDAGYEWSFDFTLAPAATGGGTQTASGTGPDSDTLDWSDLVPGTEYMISETTSGDYTQNVECTGVEDLDESATTVTFVAGFDQSITCAASNAAQPSTVTLAKTVSGVADDYAWSFDFALAPEATGGGTQTISGVGNVTPDPIAWSDLVPGTQYVISEVANGDYSQTLECTGVEDLDESATTVTFVAGFGQAIVCAADNEAVASQLSVTKTVAGLTAAEQPDFEWSFDFTLTPPAGEVDTATLTGVGDGTSDAATWAGLVPGVTYTIAETVNADFTPELVCDGVEDLDSSVSSVTFVAGFGQTVTCVATNTVVVKEGTLSETGASLGGLGVAVIFLLGGGVLVLVARRRRYL